MKNSKLLFFLVLVLLLGSCGNRRKARKERNNPTIAESFVWVENGVAKAPIIVPKNVTPRTMDAAQELSVYVEKISGAKPQILQGAPKNMPASAVWIGYHDELKSIFSKLDFNLKHEEIVIVANKNHLAIFGDDRLSFGFQDVIFQDRRIPNAQKSYGTVNAIYSFLQDDLHVRWFWPDELGEDIIVSKNIAISAMEYRYTPQMTWRSGLIITSRPGRNQRESNVDIWTKRQRMFLSSEMINGGHPFKDWWDRYNKQFPNVFALTDRGDRTPINGGTNVKLCVSNPQVINLWLTEVQDMLKENPFLSKFSVNENDSYNLGHCVCEHCQKWDEVSVLQKNKNLSDRHLKFANLLVEALRKKHPNKEDFELLYFAYGNNRPLPIREKPHPKVGVVSVANFHLRRKSVLDTTERAVKEFHDWSKIAKTIYWRPNIGNPVGWQWGMPDVAFSQVFDDFRFVAENGAKGVFMDSYSDHWSTQGIQYYFASQLTWNPYLNKEEALNDYFTRLYGPGHDELRLFWEKCEAARTELHGLYGSEGARYEIHKVYDNQWFAEAKALLQKAKSKVSKSEPKYIKRIEFTEQGLIHTERLVKLRALMTQHENNRNVSAEIAAIWGQMENDARNFNSNAINHRYISVGRRVELNKRMLKRLNGLIIESPRVVRKSNRDEEGLE